MDQPLDARARRAAPAGPEQASTRLVFFVAGFATAAWAPLAPFAKMRAGVDEGVLGLLLLCLGLGSIVAMPLAGAMCQRWGCRAVIAGAATLGCLALPCLAYASNLAALAGLLFAFGAGVGSMDVSMNIQAIMVERASRRAMMSGFHGLFSLGGIAGAGGVTALLGGGAGPLAAATAISACSLAIVAVAFRHLLPYGGEGGGPAFAWPRGVVLALGGLCFMIFLTEGAMLDWSAIALSAVHGVEPALAGLGYVAFAIAMTLGRLTGDRIVQAFGGPAVIAVGGVCAAMGLALGALAPTWGGALLGYALVGAGCSNIVPVLFTSAGRQTAMPESVAVPAITTLGYAGILAGPAAIGLVAHWASLQASFLILAALLLGVAASALALRVGASPR
ncbi:MFS transporter [Alsobacter sp. KACC 23698]|uniref:MFS transporter n=1 Tax=Alsobacter sp. KACC 23698 TaxID=3149229 RepID=A0AAU7JLN5_9HYPH